jgi:hypothetical protein
MTTATREPQIPLDTITHISADLGRAGGRVVAVIIGWRRLCRGRATSPAVVRCPGDSEAGKCVGYSFVGQVPLESLG